MTLSELVEWVRGVPGSLPEEMRPMAESICEAFLSAAGEGLRRRFRIEPCELRRGGTSYTVDTLEALAAQCLCWLLAWLPRLALGVCLGAHALTVGRAQAPGHVHHKPALLGGLQLGQHVSGPGLKHLKFSHGLQRKA